MPITVDRELLPVELELRTLGDVFAHLKRENRLVVQVLIDGAEPEGNEISTMRQKLVSDHAVFIETADPRELAREVLSDVLQQIDEAGETKDQAAELLQANQSGKALALLARTIRTWQNAQESVSKVAELLRFDLEEIRFHGKSLRQMLAEFAEQLRQIKVALNQRDFVLLSDVLMYETAETNENWRGALVAMRERIGEE